LAELLLVHQVKLIPPFVWTQSR